MATTAVLTRSVSQNGSHERQTKSAAATKVDSAEPVSQPPSTINELIRQRAQDGGCNDPIVAYPSSGTNYIYYTPNEVA